MNCNHIGWIWAGRAMFYLHLPSKIASMVLFKLSAWLCMKNIVSEMASDLPLNFLAFFWRSRWCDVGECVCFTIGKYSSLVTLLNQDLPFNSIREKILFLKMKLHDGSRSRQKTLSTMASEGLPRKYFRGNSFHQNFMNEQKFDATL